MHEGCDDADTGHDYGSEWAVLYRMVMTELAPSAYPTLDWGLDMACRCVTLMGHAPQFVERWRRQSITRTV